MNQILQASALAYGSSAHGIGQMDNSRFIAYH